jgi:hypothetical protein
VGIILKWVLKILVVGWYRFVPLRTGTSDSLFLTQEETPVLNGRLNIC